MQPSSWTCKNVCLTKRHSLHQPWRVFFRSSAHREYIAAHSPSAQATAHRSKCISRSSTKNIKTDTQNSNQKSTGCNCPIPCISAVAAESTASTAKATWPYSMLHSGPLFLTAGAFVCSFISLQIKLFDQPVPPLEVTAFSSAVSWLATGIIMRSSGMSSSLGCQARGFNKVSLLMLRGLLAAATVVCYYSSIESLPLSVAVALFFFNPVFCVILDALVTGRRLSVTALASCLLTVVGVLIIGWHDQIVWYIGQMMKAAQPAVQLDAAVQSGVPPVADLSVSGVLFGLAAAAANAAAFVCVGVIGPGVSPLCLTWWQHLVVAHVAVAAILAQAIDPLEFRIYNSSFLNSFGDLFGSAALAAAAGSSSNSDLEPWTSEIWNGLILDASDALSDVQGALPTVHDALLLMGIITANFVGQLMLNAGFQRMDAGRGSAINTSQVLFGCIWDVTLLHSAPSLAMWLGSTAIAAGVFGTTLSKQDPRLQEHPQ